MFLPWMKELNGSEDFKLCLLEIPGRGMRKKDGHKRCPLHYRKISKEVSY